MKRFKRGDIENLDITYKVISHKKENYVNLPMAFDIETTSTYTNGMKFAFMYEWTFGIRANNKNYVWYGRTWDEYFSLLDELFTRFKMYHTKCVVYVHNLGYEFQFFRKLFQWDNVFSTAERKPIRANTTQNLEYRDSYILSGMSLVKTAENLTTYKVKKLVGDLDYSLVRTSKTKMSRKELAYCNNDVEVVLCYIQEQIEQYGNICKIPMTNTGRVRKFVKEWCLSSGKKNHRKGSTGNYQRYRKRMKALTMNVETYKIAKACFLGGFTHANFRHVDKLLQNVHSIDFTSSYPAVMLTERYPMETPYKFKGKRVELMRKILEGYGAVFYLRLENVCAKISENYISKSRCIKIEGETENNGRIYSADVIELWVTEVDYKIIYADYEFTKSYISYPYIFRKMYLPQKLIQAILKLYGDKTKLKGVKGKEVEYLISKGMLNSIYGMSVTDIVHTEYKYEGEWSKTKLTQDDVQEQLDKYNNSVNRVLYYWWGVYVTAYARRNLWTGILEMRDDYIYSDTDSLKFFNLDKHQAYINAYNQRIEFKLRKMCDLYNIDFALCEPKTIKGKKKLIGVWDYEGMYKYFKTLGAKRYLTYDDNNGLQVTCAGLAKKAGTEYLQKISKDTIDVFNHFTNKLYIPSAETGKNTHTYIDEEITALIKDYQGNIEKVTSKSSIHLEPCEFTLDRSRQFITFLQNFMNGYIMKEGLI